VTHPLTNFLTKEWIFSERETIPSLESLLSLFSPSFGKISPPLAEIYYGGNFSSPMVEGFYFIREAIEKIAPPPPPLSLEREREFPFISRPQFPLSFPGMQVFLFFPLSCRKRLSVSLFSPPFSVDIRAPVLFFK